MKRLEVGNWIVEVGEKEIVIRNKEMNVVYRLNKESNGYVEFENGYYKGTLYYGDLQVKHKRTGRKGWVDFRNVIEP